MSINDLLNWLLGITVVACLIGVVVIQLSFHGYIGSVFINVDSKPEKKVERKKFELAREGNVYERQ